MHRFILLLALAACAAPCRAELYGEFGSWQELAEKSPDIVFAECRTTPNPTVILDGIIRTEIEVLNVLKGHSKTGPATLYSSFHPRQGERFLLFAHFSVKDGEKLYGATESYRAVPLGLHYRLDHEGQPLEAQIQRMLDARRDMVEQEIRRLEAERHRMELSWSARARAPEVDYFEFNNKWHRRKQEVPPGSPLEVVERVFPPYLPPQEPGEHSPYAEVSVDNLPGRQVVSYYVSPGWRLTAAYDAAGAKLVAPLDLEKRPQIQRLTFDAELFARAVNWQGKLAHAARWRDAEGEHVVLISEKPSALHAMLYTLKKGRLTRRWAVDDTGGDCDSPRFVMDDHSLSLTDDDGDGIAETIFTYRKQCGGKAGHSVLTLVYHEGDQELVIRGGDQAGAGDPQVTNSEAGIDDAARTRMLQRWRQLAGK
jgi:hypothetical protein